ncbi:MAG: YdbL family protein [Candidatus Lindowbacteria bacterium]|nr:YdbL family protein [Candidatus Lindowbacteria bacterium]
MRKTIQVATMMALFLTLACVTVNVYFPAAEVQHAADKIVEEVHGKQPSSTAPEGEPKQSMFRRVIDGISPFGGVAYAQVDINITTPNVRALRASMKERFDSIRPLYDKGVIGEANDGLVAIRSLEGLDLKGKADANKLVKAENADRENLYKEIAKANELSPDTVPQIKKLFANSWRKNAQKGWWIQKESGEWTRKE